MGRLAPAQHDQRLQPDVEVGAVEPHEDHNATHGEAAHHPRDVLRFGKRTDQRVGQRQRRRHHQQRQSDRGPAIGLDRGQIGRPHQRPHHDRQRGKEQQVELHVLPEVLGLLERFVEMQRRQLGDRTNQRVPGHVDAGGEPGRGGEIEQRGQEEPQPSRFLAGAPDPPQRHGDQERADIDHRLVDADREGAERRQHQPLAEAQPVAGDQGHADEDRHRIERVVLAHDEEGRRQEDDGDGGEHARQQDGVVARAIKRRGIEDRRQAEEAQRQQLRQEMQVGHPQGHRRHDRHLGRDHRVDARRIEKEELLVGHDLDEECEAVDEQAAANPAVPECQRPDQADCGSISERGGGHRGLRQALQPPRPGRKIYSCAAGLQRR